MAYARVIPRDLFNEADLLKCYGRLWIELDNRRGHSACLGAPCSDDDYDGEPFEIVQDEATGSLEIANVFLLIDGERFPLSRPLNARSPWPLWCHAPDGENEWRIFDEEGNLSAEFLELISNG